MKRSAVKSDTAATALAVCTITDRTDLPIWVSGMCSWARTTIGGAPRRRAIGAMSPTRGVLAWMTSALKRRAAVREREPAGAELRAGPSASGPGAGAGSRPRSAATCARSRAVDLLREPPGVRAGDAARRARREARRRVASGIPPRRSRRSVWFASRILTGRSDPGCHVNARRDEAARTGYAAMCSRRCASEFPFPLPL